MGRYVVGGDKYFLPQTWLFSFVYRGCLDLGHLVVDSVYLGSIFAILGTLLKGQLAVLKLKKERFWLGKGLLQKSLAQLAAILSIQQQTIFQILRFQLPVQTLSTGFINTVSDRHHAKFPDWLSIEPHNTRTLWFLLSNNQTQMQIIQISVAQPTAQLDAFPIDVFKLLRIVLYFYFFIKVMEILLTQRKKLSTRERMLRRFNFAHESIFGLLDKEELIELEGTFKNTMANVDISADPSTRTKKSKGNRSSKSIMISESLNEYYDHIQPEQKDESVQTQNAGQSHEQPKFPKNTSPEMLTLAVQQQALQSTSQHNAVLAPNQNKEQGGAIQPQPLGEVQTLVDESPISNDPQSVDDVD